MDVAVLGMGRMGRALAGRLLEGADVVITMLADDDAVRAVAFGELQPSFGGKAIYADCSTVSPELAGELAEALAVGRCGGLTDERLRELLTESPMLAPGVRNRFEAILAGSHNGWWATALGAKDVGLAIAFAGAAGVELPAAEQLKRLYDQAAARGLGDADIVAVTDLYRGPAVAS